MQLTEAHATDVSALMGWFPDARSCFVWSGPDFRFPYSAESFLADTRIAELPSRVLLDDDGALLAFGQYYERLGRCHLGRLVVSPRHRGRALGATLIRGLARCGAADIGAAECSLFVLKDNAPAQRLYRRLGFDDCEYPEPLPWIEQCDYLVVPTARLLQT